MPCGLVFRYIRTRLAARKRRRGERQNGANDLNPTKKSSKLTSTSEIDKARASILGELLHGQKDTPVNLTLTHTDEFVKVLSTTPRSEPGVSAAATLSNTLPPPPEELIDPAKSYLTRLPRELKLEIIDHICSHETGFVKDPTEVAFAKRPNLVNLRLSVHVHGPGVW